ncbi:MAG: methyltransferase domain-containing protein [Methanobacteriaceae archaeon]
MILITIKGDAIINKINLLESLWKKELNLKDDDNRGENSNRANNRDNNNNNNNSKRSKDRKEDSGIYNNSNINENIWDKRAKDFSKRVKKDEYIKQFLGKINSSLNNEENNGNINGNTTINTKELTVLDLGCGEGTITIPLSKTFKSVTAVDSSYKMLEILKEKVESEEEIVKSSNKNNISNNIDMGVTKIKLVKKDLKEINIENTNEHDIVIASRSLNKIENISGQLSRMNELAERAVYLTLWGPDARMFEKTIYPLIGAEKYTYGSYIHVYNILYEMGIYANIERIKIKSNPIKSQIDTINIIGNNKCNKNNDINNIHNYNKNMDNYKNNLENIVDDIFNSFKWRIKNIEKEEEKKNKIKEFIKNDLINNNGNCIDSFRSTDWILIWWNKE